MLLKCKMTLQVIFTIIFNHFFIVPIPVRPNKDTVRYERTNLNCWKIFLLYMSPNMLLSHTKVSLKTKKTVMGPLTVLIIITRALVMPSVFVNCFHICFPAVSFMGYYFFAAQYVPGSIAKAKTFPICTKWEQSLLIGRGHRIADRQDALCVPEYWGDEFLLKQRLLVLRFAIDISTSCHFPDRFWLALRAGNPFYAPLTE